MDLNKQKHLEHPFYKKVKAITDNIAIEQIVKGSEKYKEPFNPSSWSNEELAIHILQELRDGQVYAVGLLDRMKEQELEIQNLRKENERLRISENYLQLRLKKEGMA
ncbi:hypothetical protein [Bacillus solitudinis]|uniref:hypothetical protein n=1 Tax=Bacillus solitudinis TaxID=2014074 RepID=UPI0012FD0CE8|nr:hypothetical protein [Bacillus solitudinis]